MIKIRYIGKKPYTITYNDVIYNLTSGQVLQIPRKAARKIKGSKFRRYFELVQNEPALEERMHTAEEELLKARDVIINLRNRITVLEAYHT